MVGQERPAGLVREGSRVALIGDSLIRCAPRTSSSAARKSGKLVAIIVRAVDRDRPLGGKAEDEEAHRDAVVAVGARTSAPPAGAAAAVDDQAVAFFTRVPRRTRVARQ